MTARQARRSIYRIARIMGDVQAGEQGPTAYAKRVARRRAYRYTGGATRRVLRALGLSR